MRISKKFSALGALVVIALGVAGCGGSGNSIPKNAVATVAGNSISLAAFNHWEYVAAKDQAAQSPGSPVIVPNDPPDFAGCIKQVHQQLPTNKTSDKVLKATCKQVFDQFKTEVMGFLIEGYWYQALAYKEGIKLTDAQLQTAFNNIKKKSFSKPGSLATYMKTTGETQADLMYQVRINQLYKKLLAKRQKTINAAAIAAYYNSHKSTFATKEYANLHLVRTKTQAEAQAAYNALKSGTSWNTVASKYSADKAGKANGGLLTNVVSGQEENAVNKAIFSSKVNKIVGPIKGTFGYYVIEVTKIVPASQQSLSQATAQIKSLLKSQNGQNAAAAVNKSAKAAFGKQTLCTNTYAVPDCNNYVAPKTTTSTTTTPATTPSGTTSGTSTAGTTTSATGSTSTATSSKSTTSTTATGTSTSKG